MHRVGLKPDLRGTEMELKPLDWFLCVAETGSLSRAALDLEVSQSMLSRAIHDLEQELGQRFPGLPLVRLLGDVKDLDQLRATFARTKPDIVFHAAAFKHVPLVEEQNAGAALRNNTLGTYHAALAAAENQVSRFVLISTDKAVNPTNVMGATKRAAEMVISSLVARFDPARVPLEPWRPGPEVLGI